MITEFLYIISLLLLLGRSSKKKMSSIQITLDHLSLIRLYANLGDYQKLLKHLTKHSQDTIVNTIRKTLLTGTFTSNNLADIETLLYQAQKYYQNNERLLELFKFRISFILIVTLISRYILAHFYLQILWSTQYQYYDRLCLMISIVMIVISLSLFKCYLPKYWFWVNCISKQGLCWSKTYLLNQSQPTMAYHPTWSLLNGRMLESGTNLTNEKRNLLLYWTWEKRKKNIIKQEKFMDLFPFFEIFGFALPAFLIVLIPCYFIFRV